jgi:hypothetical protein
MIKLLILYFLGSIISKNKTYAFCLLSTDRDVAFFYSSPMYLLIKFIKNVPYQYHHYYVLIFEAAALICGMSRDISKALLLGRDEGHTAVPSLLYLLPPCCLARIYWEHLADRCLWSRGNVLHCAAKLCTTNDRGVYNVTLAQFWFKLWQGESLELPVGLERRSDCSYSVSDSSVVCMHKSVVNNLRHGNYICKSVEKLPVGLVRRSVCSYSSVPGRNLCGPLLRVHILVKLWQFRVKVTQGQTSAGLYSGLEENRSKGHEKPPPWCSVARTQHVHDWQT